MSGEPVPDDLDPRALDSALAELARTIDGLRDRLRGRERAPSREAPAGAGHEVAPAGGDEFTPVQEILSIPASGLQPRELFTLATDRVSRLLAADRVMLFVAEGNRLLPRSARGFRRDDLESIVVEPGEGMVGRAFLERRVLSHATGAAAVEDWFIERFPVTDAIAVPVRVEDEVVGVLYAGRRAGGARFGAHDRLVLLVAADRVAGALIQQGLLDRRGAYIARLAELASFAGETPLGRDTKEILERACEIGCRLTGVRAAAVAIGVEDLELVAARGLPRGLEAWRSVSRREGLTAELYAGNGPVACRDVQARRGAERSFLGGAGFHGCLLLPLRVRGLMLGAFYLADTEVRDFSVEEVEVARLLAAMTAAAVEDSRVYGKLAGAFEAARSDQARALEAEKTRSLAEIAAGLAREFNQIFAVILGKSQLLLGRAGDDAVREGLSVIEEAAWRGADVLRSIAALAAPAAEKPGEVADMKAIVQDAIALARSRWTDDRQGRIEVVTNLEAAPPVRGNEAALRAAVSNLVENAVDAMPDGGRLGVTLRRRDDGVELVVEDTGTGIAEDVRRRMFEPFFTTRSPSRVGLGLTVVRSVVTRHGGRVEVVGSASRGTTATIWLPAAAPAPAPSPAPATGEAVGGPAEGRPAPLARAPEPVREERRERAAVLVLEDEEPVRAMLVEALTGAGHDVRAAADGTAGLSEIESRSFDVVLADLALPQLSGLAVARSVKRLCPRTPVILITGWGHLLDPERLREHGVDLMLVKPFRAERAIAIVSDALRLHASA
jgi:signal transduction histidine kinase/CheY-like chemotaxis protein